MRYSYAFKLMCVVLYWQGKWPDTPIGVKEKTFRNMIRIWVRQEAASGVEDLQHRKQNREWTADEKYAYLAKVLAGESYKEVAISAGIECSLMFYGSEKEYTSFNSFAAAMDKYIDYYNNRRIQAKTKWMPPPKFREASMMAS